VFQQLIGAEDEAVTFQVAVLPRSPAIKVHQHVASLRWEQDGSIVPAMFVVDAEQVGLAVLDVYLHRDYDLIAVASLRYPLIFSGLISMRYASAVINRLASPPRHPRLPISRNGDAAPYS